jgi:excinuclease UvrABC ATPase subunit
MRAVSAPRLFANNDAIERFLGDVERVQRELIENLYALKKEDNSVLLIRTQILPLKEQRVFVLIGTEAGVSGVESLIKAGEQSAAEPVKESKSGK